MCLEAELRQQRPSLLALKVCAVDRVLHANQYDAQELRCTMFRAPTGTYGCLSSWCRTRSAVLPKTYHILRQHSAIVVTRGTQASFELLHQEAHYGLPVWFEGKDAATVSMHHNRPH